MLLADGRRVVPCRLAAAAAHAAPRRRLPRRSSSPTAPATFLGNDFFREMGDMLATHVVDNPALPSELALLAAYAPDVPPPLLRRIAAIFGELRSMADAGEIAYPYSTREAVALVKHLQSFPSDGLLAAAENVFAFDGHEPAIAQTITSVLRRHGVPAGGGAGAFDVRLAAEEDLPPSEPLELWSAGSGGAEVPLQAVEVGGARWAGGRQASWRLERSPDEPSLGWQQGCLRVFSEELGRWRLPPRLQAGSIIAGAAAAGGSLHLITAGVGGLQLLSYSADGARCRRCALGRGWAGADTRTALRSTRYPTRVSSSTCRSPLSSCFSARKATPKPPTPLMLPPTAAPARRRHGRGGGRHLATASTLRVTALDAARGGARRARQGRRRSRRRVAVGRLHRRAARRRRCGARRRWRVGVRRWWCRFAAAATEPPGRRSAPAPGCRSRRAAKGGVVAVASLPPGAAHRATSPRRRASHCPARRRWRCRRRRAVACRTRRHAPARTDWLRRRRRRRRRSRRPARGNARGRGAHSHGAARRRGGRRGGDQSTSCWRAGRAFCTERRPELMRAARRRRRAGDGHPRAPAPTDAVPRAWCCRAAAAPARRRSRFTCDARVGRRRDAR